MSEKPKRRSRTLEALEKQIEEDKARAEEEPDMANDMMDHLFEEITGTKKDEK